MPLTNADKLRKLNLSEEHVNLLLEEVKKTEDKKNKYKVQAEENKQRINQINFNSSLKEKMEILAFLKNKNGENQISKGYLKGISKLEIDKIYDDCLMTMPNEMEEAKKAREKAIEDGIEIFDDYNFEKEKKPEEPSAEEVKLEEDSKQNEEIKEDTNHDNEEPLEDKEQEVADDEIEKSADKIINEPSKGKEKVSKIRESGAKLIGAINEKNVKTALVAGAAVAAVALLVANAPVAIMAGAGLIIGKEQIKKGKGR